MTKTILAALTIVFAVSAGAAGASAKNHYLGYPDWAVEAFSAGHDGRSDR